MAKFKKEEEPKVDTIAPETNEPDVANKPAEGAENEEKKTVDAVKAVDATDEGILATLKLYPDLAEAYVNKFGCVYTNDTPKSIVGKAVLYKNPYFNK